jgi:microcystin-dependent protein
MAEPFLGMLILVPYNFAPRGWAFCQGQILPIAQNTALFSLLGTTFGGNGQTTFALPDLRGRVPVGAGQGPGLSSVLLGEEGGNESKTLLITNLPPHNHSASPANLKATVHAVSVPGNKQDAVGNVFAKEAAGVTATYSNVPPPVGQPYPLKMSDDAVTMSGFTDPAGGGQPFDIHTPFLGMNYCIALEGIFPSRN